MKSSWRRLAPLAVVLAVGAALRLRAIGSQPLWTDEALTGAIALHPPLDLALDPIDPTGPLYYWLYRLILPEGACAVAARLPSVVAGLATILLVFGLGKRIAGWTAGLIAAVFVAASAPLVDYSQEARSYALALMLIAGSAWTLAGLLRTDNAGKTVHGLALFAGFSIAAIFTHLIGLFWAATALAILFLSTDRVAKGKVTRTQALVTICAVILPALIEVRRLVRYATEVNGFTWLEQPSPVEILRMVAGQWLPFAWMGTGAIIAGSLLVAILLWQVRRPLFELARQRPMVSLLGVALLLQPLLPWLIGYFFSPIAMPRTVLPGTIGFALLMAVAIARLRPTLRWWIAAAATASTLASTLVQGTVRVKEDWLGASSASAGASLLVICPMWKAVALLASDSGGSALVMVPVGRALVLVRRHASRTPWDRAYFERVSLPLLRISDGQDVEREQVLLVTNSLTLVTSECAPKDRALVRRWFQPTSSELLFRSTGPGAVAVERWTGGTPRRLQVIVLLRKEPLPGSSFVTRRCPSRFRSKW